MSAYIVNHACIDAIVTFAVDNHISYRDESCDNLIDPTNATEIGKVLMLECERSVQHRYPHINHEVLPGTVDERSGNYKFKRTECFRVHEQVKEYDYQACETNDYEQSVAYRIIQAIETKLETQT